LPIPSGPCLDARETIGVESPSSEALGIKAGGFYVFDFLRRLCITTVQGYFDQVAARIEIEELEGLPSYQDRAAMRGNIRGIHMQRDKIMIDLLIHDLKGPLSVIETGISSLLGRREKYGPLTEQQDKVLVRALRNTKIIRTLVNDALELGRSGAGVINVTRSKISDVIEHCLVEIFDMVDRDTSERIKICADLPRLREALEEKGIKLSIDQGLWCQEVFVDEAKIRQVLRNLLSNALKYRKNHVEVVVDKGDDHLFFSVEDDGEGIPQIYHKKIFESYFQLDVSDAHTVRGHGLGLAGVMVLVEDMKGELSLKSDEGQGAKFLVKVPLADR
jgi:two-component system OmpR family sensor kinase